MLVIEVGPIDILVGRRTAFPGESGSGKEQAGPRGAGSEAFADHDPGVGGAAARLTIPCNLASLHAAVAGEGPIDKVQAVLGAIDVRANGAVNRPLAAGVYRRGARGVHKANLLFQITGRRRRASHCRQRECQRPR